jgi:hypothetical protein
MLVVITAKQQDIAFIYDLSPIVIPLLKLELLEFEPHPKTVQAKSRL